MQVACFQPVHDQSELGPLIQQYNQSKQQLEDTLDDYSRQIAKLRAQQHRRDAHRHTHVRKSRSWLKIPCFGGSQPSIKLHTFRVVGPLYGSWGINTFGTRPRKVHVLIAML